MIARNFVDARDAVPEMHGTAVAGIIGARADNGDGDRRRGAGRAADGAARVLATAGRRIAAVCSSFTLAKALQFALDNDARVINLSLGGPRDRLLERLLEVAARAAS